jgi:hypothetical protein
MSITETTPSPQYKQHWLAEQALNWSGLPVVHVRPVSRRLLPDFDSGFSQGIRSDQATVRGGQDFACGSGRRCAGDHRTARQSAAAHQQDLSPDRSAVREHAFLCTGVFEGAGPHNHLSGHSGRAVAGRAAQAGLAGSRGEPPGGDGPSSRRSGVRWRVAQSVIRMKSEERI